MSDILKKYTEPYPQLELFYCDEATYNRFRTHEQQLVSILDKGTHEAIHRVVALRAYGEEVGITSYTLHENAMRPDARKYYARIDLVIVPESFRRLGISKVVLLAGLVDIWRDFSDKIYSISCLAGHEAVAHILNELEFVENRQKKDDFRHFEQRISDESAEALIHKYSDKLHLALRSTNYKFRQRQL